jgi:hypothetical protein
VTGRDAMVRMKLYIFLTPYSENEMGVFTWGYTKSKYPGPTGSVRWFRRLIARKLSHEIQLDANIISNLGDKDPSIEGMKLSRFDRVLGLNRERIERIYRGQPVAVS